MISTIALGADHAGSRLEKTLEGWLTDHGYRGVEHGTHVTDAADSPSQQAAGSDGLA